MAMRTTLVLDDELVARAQALTGINDVAALIDEALKVLVARESARHLQHFGGSDPEAVAAPRRRSTSR
jgi:Arc/MetJ family transcription regulator